MAGYTRGWLMEVGKKIDERLSKAEKFYDICRDMKIDKHLGQLSLAMYKGNTWKTKSNPELVKR